MVLARMAIWKFKRGMRRKSFDMLDQTITEATRKGKGFRGNLTLLSIDDPDTGVIITLWANENSLKAYTKGVFQAKANKLKQFVIAPPEVKHYRVFSEELKH